MITANEKINLISRSAMNAHHLADYYLCVCDFRPKKAFRALYFCSLKTLIMIIEQIYTECLAKSAYYIEAEDDLFRRMA